MLEKVDWYINTDKSLLSKLVANIPSFTTRIFREKMDSDISLVTYLDLESLPGFEEYKYRPDHDSPIPRHANLDVLIRQHIFTAAELDSLQVVHLVY